ncbi:hypothetical protein ACPA9J_31690 [Pseudomonas aeruginosa]
MHYTGMAAMRSVATAVLPAIAVRPFGTDCHRRRASPPSPRSPTCAAGAARATAT